jgi:cytochrome P450
MPSVLRPECNIDFTDPEINHDPYPYLDQMRELAPAVWNEPSDSWFVTSFDNVRMVFGNFADFAQAEAMYADIFRGPVMVSVDNPRHNELRSVWGPYLSRKAVEDYADLARAIADEHLDPLLDRLRDGEAVDVVPALRQIPTQLIATLLGVPHDDCARFVAWAQEMVSIFDVYEAPGIEDAEKLQAAGLTAAKELHDYSGEILAARRRAGGADDMLGVLATSNVGMTEQEMRSYITLLIFGAQDTTTKFSTNAVSAFAQHPDQRRALADDRELMPQALDEVIRWQCPVSADVKVARHAEVRIGDVPIPEGAHVTPVCGAANRDPARWDDPNTFDISRPRQANVGFGFGVHSCIGVNLARLVVRTVLTKMLDAAPEYKLDVSADELDYGRSFPIRGALSLPLSN